MGRLLAIAAVVTAIGVGVVVAVGPGTDRPEPRDARTPARESARVAPSRSAGTEARSPAAAHARVGATVRMVGLRFRPRVVHVRAGEAVRWVNDDDVAHTVYQDVGSRSGVEPLFASQRLPPGDGFEFVPRAPGRILYVCTLHPSIMHGVIVVDGAPA